MIYKYHIIYLVENNDFVIILLNGDEESRLIRLNLDSQEIIWSVPVPDNSVNNPIQINNLLLLTSNRWRNAESALFAYDINTGLNQFIREFPKDENRYVTFEIAQNYNVKANDSLSILIFKRKRPEGTNKVQKEIILLDMKGRSLWNTPIEIPSLAGKRINVIKSATE